MPRPCLICQNPSIKVINRALTTGQSFARVAAQFGLNETSVRHHAHTHLAGRIRAAQKARDMYSIQEISKRLEEMDAAAKQVLGEDRKSDHRLFWQGMEVSGRNLERIYRLGIGSELDERLKRLEEQGNADTDRD